MADRMAAMGIHLDAGEDAVAERMLDGTLKEGDTARLTVENEKLCVTK